MKTHSIRIISPILALAGALALDGSIASAQFSVLHTFTGGADGASPYYGAPVISGSTIYGTVDLGANGGGVVFSENTDGTGYSVLHTFSSAAGDGYGPLGSVVLSGSTLYGTTYNGGSAGGGSGNGTVFAVNTDGTGYQTIYSFGLSAGYKPYGTVVVSGSTIYGTTYYSGGGLGSIYSVNTGGGSYTTLHTFAGGTSDGSRPLGGALTLSGSTLYGTTVHGGTGASTSDGVAFGINTDGSGYNNLVNFTGGAVGANPYGGLRLVGSKLYGMTLKGGSANDGTIFSVNTDGSDYTTLYTFTGGADSGVNPNGGLTFDGSVLYGTTKLGGSANKGTVFEINLDGSGFEILHSFSGGTDGANPEGDLALANNTLYGWTSYGASANDGTLFAITVPEPSVYALSASGFGLLLLFQRRKSAGVSEP